MTLLLPIIVLSAGLSAQSQPQNLPDTPQPQQSVQRPESSGPAESSSRDSAPPPAAQPRVDKTAQPDSADAPAASGDTPAANAGQPVRNPATPDTDRLYKISSTTNFVEIPVTVKDRSGHMVEGLLPKDFTVYENGARQKLTYFTSDPLAISAAVLIDVGMSDTALRKVQSGIQALQGAFSQYDEVAVYTYGNSVAKESSFGTAGDRLTAALNHIVETKHGQQQGGVPVGGGPFAGGPTVNGRPFDPSVPQVPIVPHDRRVLNDAVLQAALDLSKVQPARRRVIMIVGDGREDGSRASYADVLKVLLTNKISVYAIGVGSAALPVYRKLEQINVPGTGTGNILPKYASATGGEVFSEFSKESIENAYSAVTLVARNQYTLGYYAQGTLADNYREIEVRVARTGVRVTAKAGYYPLPPGRQ
ncbi:MAG TPA: VWA domain-containing protein [Terriglobales bacterium]|nr:VWA domain-containing protein [Terriglobales bacterium]